MIKSLFETKIYMVHYPDLDELNRLTNEFVVDLPFSKKINDVIWRRPGCPDGIDTTTMHWFVNDPNHPPEFLHKNPAFKNVVDFISMHAKIYWEELKYKPNLEPVLANSWVQRYRGGSHELGVHNHPAMVPIVGSLYLNSSPGQGNLVLEHPLDMMLSQVSYMSGGRNERLYDIDVTTGLLLLWPGWLKHSVMPNTTEKTRYTWAMEFYANEKQT